LDFFASVEYGTKHNLGKLGHGIRICKLLYFLFSILLDYEL